MDKVELILTAIGGLISLLLSLGIFQKRDELNHSKQRDAATDSLELVRKLSKKENIEHAIEAGLENVETIRGHVVKSKKLIRKTRAFFKARLSEDEAREPVVR